LPLISPLNSFLVLFAFHVGLKIKSTIVRHRYGSSWFTYQAFGYPLIVTISET